MRDVVGTRASLQERLPLDPSKLRPLSRPPSFASTRLRSHSDTPAARTPYASRLTPRLARRLHAHTGPSISLVGFIRFLRGVQLQSYRMRRTTTTSTIRAYRILDTS